MEELKILPMTIYKFEVPKDICNSLIKNVKNTKTRLRGGKEYHGSSSSGFDSLHTKKEYRPAVRYINQQVAQVAKEVLYTQMDELKICLMWVNKSKTNQWHHAHHHGWSFLSGIIYLQGENGRTWFSRESDYNYSKSMSLMTNEDVEASEIIYKHKPEPGSMVIFPSSLLHSVDANTDSSERITISFNTFPTGQVGSKDELKGIDIEVK